MTSLPAALLLLPALTLAAAQPSRTETRVEPLAMGAKLWVTQQDGNLDVQGWDRPELAIEATFQDGGGRRATLELRRVPAGLELEVKEPHRFWWFGRFGQRRAICHLRLRVPRKLCLAAKSVDGSLSVRDLDGYAGLHTVDGSIRVEAISGEVHASTVDGAIDARQLNARLKGGSVDGRITVDQVSGGLELSTVDGTITASHLDGWGEGIHLSAVDGAIHLTLGAAAGKVEASSVDGAVSTRHPRLVVTERRDHFLRGQVPGRDQAIQLHTVDGAIQID